MSSDIVDINEFAGFCPICREKMAEIKDKVVCPAGDYEANFDEWDRAWFAFDVAMGDADEFLKFLLDLNTVVVVALPDDHPLREHD